LGLGAAPALGGARADQVERLGEATLGTRRGEVSLTGMLKDSPIRVIQAGESK